MKDGSSTQLFHREEKPRAGSIKRKGELGRKAASGRKLLAACWSFDHSLFSLWRKAGSNARLLFTLLFSLENISRAILKVSNVMDRSCWQKIRKKRCSRIDPTYVI